MLSRYALDGYWHDYLTTKRVLSVRTTELPAFNAPSPHVKILNFSNFASTLSTTNTHKSSLSTYIYQLHRLLPQSFRPLVHEISSESQQLTTPRHLYGTGGCSLHCDNLVPTSRKLNKDPNETNSELKYMQVRDIQAPITGALRTQDKETFYLGSNTRISSWEGDSVLRFSHRWILHNGLDSCVVCSVPSCSRQLPTVG